MPNHDPADDFAEFLEESRRKRHTPECMKRTRIGVPEADACDCPQDSEDSDGALSAAEFALLDALAAMWEQYCPPPSGHAFMMAGERAFSVLAGYGVLTEDGTVDDGRLLRLMPAEVSDAQP